MVIHPDEVRHSQVGYGGLEAVRKVFIRAELSETMPTRACEETIVTDPA